MIVYRCLSSDEIISMINNKSYDKALIKGNNTFHYDSLDSYKHFFLFGEHAYYYMGRGKDYPCMGQFIIPDEIIAEKDFGYYGSIKTERNDKLYGWYMPLPEVIIKMSDLKKSYLYKIESNLYNCFITNSLDGDDNKKYNEPILSEFRVETNDCSYLDYSYADVYYEMIYQLAKNYDMDFDKVISILDNVNLYEEIRKYYESNINFFYSQTEEYLKLKQKNKSIWRRLFN